MKQVVSEDRESVKRHLAYAGADHDIFSYGAAEEIYRFSSGAARLVNKVCTHCLIYGVKTAAGSLTTTC